MVLNDLRGHLFAMDTELARDQESIMHSLYLDERLGEIEPCLSTQDEEIAILTVAKTSLQERVMTLDESVTTTMQSRRDLFSVFSRIFKEVIGHPDVFSALTRVSMAAVHYGMYVASSEYMDAYLTALPEACSFMEEGAAGDM